MVETRPPGQGSGILFFLGVSTSGSSIMRLFPAWAAHLGLDARIEGIDIPLDAPDAHYVESIQALASDPDARGALITTHKAGVFDAARQVFASLDHYALICREVSCVAVRQGRLLGWAKDPITAGLALGHMFDSGHFARSGGHVLCFGAGGAGLAIAVSMLTRQDPPERMVIVDSNPARSQLARTVVDELGIDVEVEILTHSDATANDALVSALPDSSLVINATGLGKDRQGSPVTSAISFPRGTIVWDLNYRGDLVFLDIARAQATARDLAIHDGWRYFLHGWTEVIAEVFDIAMTAQRFDELAEIADRVSGRRQGMVTAEVSDA